MQPCERCGAQAEGWKLLDYCLECSCTLCGECMQKGCCNNEPALSGVDSDNEVWEKESEV